VTDRERREDGQFDAEGNYILEDTGETLEDFAEQVTLERPIVAGATAGPDLEIERLQKENADLRDLYIRKLAEFENFRKRSEREKAEFFRYALADFLRDLLGVIDNFDRAVAGSADAPEEYRRGLELVQKQLVEATRRNGLTPIDESGVPFDPEMHEGILREENPDVPSHTVTEVLQKGYFLHDRLLRPAMVKVAVGGPDREDPPAAGPEES
jgi:molecular chaperone GrpE